jgi:hypothetical protein
MRIAIAFESIYFLLTLILMEVSSLREFNGLSCGGAKPPPVAVLNFAEYDELQVTTGRHPTPSWEAFRFIAYPTRSGAGSKHALILRAFCSANFALKSSFAIPTMRARVSRYSAACEMPERLEHRAALQEVRRARTAHPGAGGRELHLRAE